MQVFFNNGIPIHLWGDHIEPEAFQQAVHLSQLPFSYHHIALMPDVHPGYGMPIGGVFAADEMIVPNAVGMDIGCGMCAVKTNLKNIERSQLKIIVNSIKKTIPMGFDKHKKPQALPVSIKSPVGTISKNEFSKIKFQLGTLGGGNHFIEIQKDKSDYIWIMLHSGSRNLGKQVAVYYNRLAAKLNKKSMLVPPVWQLNPLDVNSAEGISYIAEMKFCMRFAYENRMMMMHKIMDIFLEKFSSCHFSDIVNIHHNYAELEKHYNKGVWVHRKGATSARLNEKGIIPGSQGTNSFIVEGKGNEESFTSCSHGAGRLMGRKEAIRKLNLQEERKMLDKKGIIHSLSKENNLDEAPGAYKNIINVINAQEELINIVEKLFPIAVIKA